LDGNSKILLHEGDEGEGKLTYGRLLITHNHPDEGIQAISRDARSIEAISKLSAPPPRVPSLPEDVELGVPLVSWSEVETSFYWGYLRHLSLNPHMHQRCISI
jgi:hypothetical protein